MYKLRTIRAACNAAARRVGTWLGHLRHLARRVETEQGCIGAAGILVGWAELICCWVEWEPVTFSWVRMRQEQRTRA